MLFYFKNKILEVKINIRISLKKIYGIGLEKSIYVNDLFGLGKNYFNLNIYLFESISLILRKYYQTEDRLKFLIKKRMMMLLDIKLIRGIRFSRGLPIRGQRTHSNAKQNKYYKKKII